MKNQAINNDWDDFSIHSYWFKVNSSKTQQTERFTKQVELLFSKLENRHKNKFYKSEITAGMSGDDFLDSKITLKISLYFKKNDSDKNND